MSDYPLPENVTSPRQHWRLIRVLFRGGEQDPMEHDPENYSVAVGIYDGNPCLGIRWNANPDRPVGHPHSRGLATWFIVPAALAPGVLATLTPESRTFAETILRPH